MIKMKTILFFTFILLTPCTEIRAQNTNQNVILNGHRKEFYPSGKLFKEYNVENGIPNGIVKSYSEKGILIAEENVVYAVPNGIQKIFYENGVVHYENNFENGKPQGTSKEYFEDGILKKNSFLTGEPWEYSGTVDLFYENGQSRTKSIYFMGKISSQINFDKEGRITYEQIDGQVKSYWYEKDGKRHTSINGKPQD